MAEKVVSQQGIHKRANLYTNYVCSDYGTFFLSSLEGDASCCHLLSITSCLELVQVNQNKLFSFHHKKYRANFQAACLNELHYFHDSTVRHLQHGICYRFYKMTYWSCTKYFVQVVFNNKLWIFFSSKSIYKAVEHKAVLDVSVFLSLRELVCKLRHQQFLVLTLLAVYSPICLLSWHLHMSIWIIYFYFCSYIIM